MEELIGFGTLLLLIVVVAFFLAYWYIAFPLLFVVIGGVWWYDRYEKREKERKAEEFNRVAAENYRRHQVQPPSPILIPPEEAIPQVWQMVGPTVPNEPWKSLFFSVVTDLVKGEQIWSHSLDAHKRAITDALIPLAKELPEIQPSPLSAPFFCFFKNPDTIQSVVWPIIRSKYHNKHLDRDLSQVHPGARDNFMAECLSTPYRTVIGRVWKGEFNITKRKWEGEPYEHYEYKYLPVEGNHKETYLDGTPFEHLLRYPVPLEYTNKKRLEHTWICGTSGSGKSTLLKRLILHDLLADGSPALVIIDSHNELIPYVSHLDLFHPEHGRLKDKLYIFGRNSLPAINIFHRYATGDEGLEDALSILRYMFTSLGVDLTGHQNLLFTPCARFLLSFRETIGRSATLDDLIQLLDVGLTEEYRTAAERVPDEINRDFMLGMFNHPTYKDRKTELLTRLAGIKNEGPTGRMLSSSETRVNLYERLNDGAVILIDAAGMGDTAPMFGRVCIALVLQAIFARYPIPLDKRRETFCFVDEAHIYFDKNTQTLLTDARKFKLGGIFAHQQLADFKDGLGPYMTGQTAIRMVGIPQEDDVNAIARYLHTEPAFLHQAANHFSTWIRGVTDHAVSVSVDADALKQPTMDDPAYEELLRRNRDRITVKARPASPPPKQSYPASPRAEPLAAVEEPAQSSVPTKRKRPKKRRGPLTGDIDTSA